LQTRTDREFFAELFFFGAEPAAIGNDGVDFAVVRDVAEGLCQAPGRLRIGRVALVKNDECRFKRGLAESSKNCGNCQG
jgi:hypothetical protein